jgi:hypothetical protein
VILLGFIGSPNNAPTRVPTFFQYDTTAAKLKPFRSFIDSFFAAIGASDTTFLKAHIKFPIRNSSFYVFDDDASGKIISSKFFFAHIKKLFPISVMRRVKREAQFFIQLLLTGRNILLLNFWAPILG